MESTALHGFRQRLLIVEHADNREQHLRDDLRPAGRSDGEHRFAGRIEHDRRAHARKRPLAGATLLFSAPTSPNAFGMPG